MLKIEREMLQAIQDKTFWGKSNTCVAYEDCNTKYGARSQVYLFGNHIGDYWHQTGEFDVNIRTLLDWPSVTTISRLRALGINITQKKWKLYIDGKYIGDKLKFDYSDGIFKKRCQF